MVELQPFALTNLCYTAGDFRQVISGSVAGEGVRNLRNDLKVETGGSGLNLSVRNGDAYISSTTSFQHYQITNDASVTVTAAAADPTNPRIDLVVAVVRDSDFGGTDDDWIVQIISGTPTPLATLANLSGAPVGPDRSIDLAYVLVPAAFAGPFVDATHILDVRRQFLAAGDRQVYYTRFQRATNQSLTDATGATITFPVASTGTAQGNDWLTEASGVVTIKRAGVYRLTGTVEFAANATGYRQVGVLVNGATYGIGTTLLAAPATRATRVPATADVSLAAGDTVGLTATQNSGGALNVSAADFSVTRVGTLVP